MKCSKAHKLISPYIDGELLKQELHELENHIRVCDTCRLELKEIRDLSSLLGATEKFQAPYGFYTRVMAAMTPDKIRANQTNPVFAWLAEGLVITAVVLLGTFSGSLLLKGDTPDRGRDVIASLSLEVFDTAPPGTLVSAYLAMTEVRNEK